LRLLLVLRERNFLLSTFKTHFNNFYVRNLL
jgi:hypothetical protein